MGFLVANQTHPGKKKYKKKPSGLFELLTPFVDLIN
jgi:hypothetical protein